MEAKVVDIALVVDLTGLAFDAGHTATIEHEIVGESDRLAVDGGDWVVENLGDAEKHFGCFAELIQGEIAASNDKTDHDHSDKDGVNYDAVLGPL